MSRDIVVLHVDDDPDFAETAATFLEKQNDRLRVETVSCPENGLDLFSDTEYHCVVSDYDMPRMDGIAFLRRIREQGSDVPFILFTGKGSEEVAAEAVSAGATGYLQKKSGTEQYDLLANRIVNAVGQFRAEKQVRKERQRFRTLFDQLSQPTVELEYETGEPIVRRVNTAFEETFGYDAADLIGDSIDPYVIPDDPTADAAVVDRPLQRGARSEAKRVVRQTADGPREFLIQLAPHGDGSGGFVIYTDVTDRS